MSNVLVRPWRRAFRVKGRATRTEYWLFLAQLLAVYFAWAMFVGGLVGQLEVPLLTAVLGIVTLLYLLFMMIASITVAVRRLHDHDKSGWLYLIVFVPFFGWIFYLIMMLTPGTKGENGYGHDPREGDLPETEAVASVFS